MHAKVFAAGAKEAEDTRLLTKDEYASIKIK